jgi:hypothetical protein
MCHISFRLEKFTIVNRHFFGDGDGDGNGDGGAVFRSFSTHTLLQFSNRPPPIGGWINDDNEKDVCDRCINMEARRAAPPKLPNGSLAPCKICAMVPECPGYLVDENSLHANISPKILGEMVNKLKSQIDLEVIFEKWPLAACYGVMRHLQLIVSGIVCCYYRWFFCFFLL